MIHNSPEEKRKGSVTMIRMEKQGKVGIMTMDYKSDNRFNPDFVRAMMDELERVEKDPEIRALVITGGDPKFFSNGLDLDWLMANAGDMDKVLGYLKLVNDMLRRWTLYPKPTVAALNGHTFAAGLFMAAHIDFRLMREDRGWICLPEVDINIPFLPGMVAICEHGLGKRAYREMAWTAKRYSGPEAVEVGFAREAVTKDEVVPRAVELARFMAKKQQPAFGLTKKRWAREVARIIDELDPGAIREAALPGK